MIPFNYNGNPKDSWLSCIVSEEENFIIIRVYDSIASASKGGVRILKSDIPEFCSRLAGLLPHKESNFKDI